MSFPLPSDMTGSPGGSQNMLNTQLFANLVRHWVHFDTTINDLNKQVKQARDTRNGYESQILTVLNSSPLKNPVLQIGGGRLVVAEERHTQPLSLRAIEELLHQYYSGKPGAKDESVDILKFIREKRTSSSTQVLKRQKPAGSSRSKDKQIF